MINKFKDFLKKFSRKRDEDFSDQDEYLEDELTDDTLQDELPPEDRTGEVIMAQENAEDEDEDLIEDEALPTKSSWKDKFKISLPTFRKKKAEALSDEEIETDAGEEEPLQAPYAEEDITGETSLPVFKPSLKEKFQRSFAVFKKKVPAVNVKDWKIPERMKGKKTENIFSLSPSLSRSTEKFLSRSARETIHQVALVVLISTFTYTLGKVTALFMKGPPTIDSPKDYTIAINLEDDFNPATLGQVRNINLFRTNAGLGRKKQIADAKCEEAQQVSNLPIKLMNTIVLQDQIKSLASVQVRGDRDLQEVRVGDQISNLAKIFKIGRLNMVIRNLESGICESITSDKLKETRTSPVSVMTPAQSRNFIANKKIPGIENEGNKFKISKKLLEDKMKDIAAILTQARAIKIQNPDGTMAFKLTEIDPEGIFPYLGLQDQDIITSINGKPIYDMNEVMSLFARIKNVDKLQLGIRRDGTESNLDYNIQK